MDKITLHRVSVTLDKDGWRKEIMIIDDVTVARSNYIRPDGRRIKKSDLLQSFSWNTDYDSINLHTNCFPEDTGQAMSMLSGKVIQLFDRIYMDVSKVKQSMNLESEPTVVNFKKFLL